MDYHGSHVMMDVGCHSCMLTPWMESPSWLMGLVHHSWTMELVWFHDTWTGILWMVPETDCDVVMSSQFYVCTLDCSWSFWIAGLVTTWTSVRHGLGDGHASVSWAWIASSSWTSSWTASLSRLNDATRESHSDSGCRTPSCVGVDRMVAELVCHFSSFSDE